MKIINTKLNNISKIVISTGVGKMRASNAQFEEKILPEIMKELSAIVGQKPSARKAKKSVAGFKIREGDIVGVVTTLRGKRKEDFFIKLSETVLPRLRDFRGLSESKVDAAGNLSLGFKDQFVFPEASPETSKITFGLEVTIVTENMSRNEAIDFLKRKGIPLVTT